MDKKIARICWNTEGWRYPSGPDGKIQAKGYQGKVPHEAEYGYGHEEWLFDRFRIKGGYHYAFLQPLNHKCHIGKTYDVYLYTRTKRSKYYVGRIKKAYSIDEEEAQEAYSYYKQQGWLKEMREELKEKGADSKYFFQTRPPRESFNVKFKFEDVIELEEPQIISPEDKSIKSQRYLFQPAGKNFQGFQLDEDELKLKNIALRERSGSSATTYELYHDKMQNDIGQLLNQSEKYTNVKMEENRVDIKAMTHDGKWHFFEIKTDRPCRLSIRAALGQIMEYSYWPDVKKAEKLIIVSDSKAGLEARRYLKHIRNKFGLPIYYRYFDAASNTLSEEI